MDSAKSGMDSTKSEKAGKKRLKAAQAETDEIISDGSASAFEGTEAVDSEETTANAKKKDKDEETSGNSSGQSNY